MNNLSLLPNKLIIDDIANRSTKYIRTQTRLLFEILVGNKNPQGNKEKNQNILSLKKFKPITRQDVLFISWHVIITTLVAIGYSSKTSHIRQMKQTISHDKFEYIMTYYFFIRRGWQAKPLTTMFLLTLMENSKTMTMLSC